MNLIPAPYRLAASLALGAALLSAAAWAGWSARAVIADMDAAVTQADHAEAIERAAALALAAERIARAEEARRTQAIEDIAHAERQAQQARAAAAARALAAADGLRNAARQATDALAAEVAGDTTPAQRSAAVAGTGFVFADVLGSCSARLAAVAAAADEARARGSACERAYDALTPLDSGR